MSMTPQTTDARAAYPQPPATRQQLFPAQQNVPAQGHYGRTGVIRPPQHGSPFRTPYTPNNPPPGAPRPNDPVVSAEQQIAQGVLSNPASGSGSNTPQRRPPQLGTTIHMTPASSMNINNAINGPANQALNFVPQRQASNGSPAMQTLQRPMTNSPAGSNLGSRPQDSPRGMDTSQDMSMIDPQLSLDSPHQHQHQHQLMSDSNTPIQSHASPGIPPAALPGEMLSPPPEGSFPTFESLFTAAQTHALAHGYAFVIGRSKRDNRGLKKVFLICDRGGVNKEKVPGEQRQRKTKSRKCGCEFGVFGIEGKTCWVMRGRIDGAHLTHNHPPSESPTEHPGARKLDPKAIAAVKTLEENGVSVKETLEILHKENPTVRFLPRDIYNARAAIKRDPSRVEATALENLPTFYKKPPMTFEEKLRAELRTEVANAQSEVEKVREEWRKEVEDLKEQLRQKDKQIQKFEMFIDICNERVMVQRQRLGGIEGEANERVNG